MTHQALRIVSDTASLDMEAAERAWDDFLTALGVDTTREGRVLRACRGTRLTTHSEGIVRQWPQMKR